MADFTPAKDWSELIKDYNDGLSIVALVSKYQISSTRIYTILKAHNIDPNRRDTTPQP